MSLLNFMIFSITLVSTPNRRTMLGVLFVPMTLYLFVVIFYLPEKLHWLDSKGQMKEAMTVLEMLRGWEDMSYEMVLIVEGLDVCDDTGIEDYVIVLSKDDNYFWNMTNRHVGLNQLKEE
ncbi:hypothetical protein E2562_015147 [Oryza meyeriana var. granulata]|uniref:Major facilitator superfamily (MFS) profile domain-containing protein n=1 Tax=Oryza meyeriana var. granulata TaxID=110450 RepID=A0A6G1DXP4_9ORYZ|nr:hypothetical protein E2562_015147 [Oryza meyeriana var. granulata]